MTDNHDDIPPLRFQDQTPISNKADNKRLCSTLSPISDDLTQIGSTIEKTMEKLLPQMATKIKEFDRSDTSDRQ